ncbi:MAG: endonuclease/exonuclease/phosphatase family protein [Acidimicrobiales bacterium]
MRIVSFNIQHARTPAGAVDTGSLARWCAGLDARVLALQEVDDGLRRSGRVDQAGAVAEATGLEVVFGPARRVGRRGWYGNALLASGPVDEVEVVALPRRSWRREPRSAIVAAVTVDGRRLSVAATHLSTAGDEAATQLAAVLGALARRPSPRVLLGDLNLHPAQVGPALVGTGLSLADPAAPTFPASAPRARIDHVAVGGLAVTGVVVMDAAPVSDHRAVVVEVAGVA